MSAEVLRHFLVASWVTLVGWLIMRIQRRPKELDAPFFSKVVQGCLIWKAVAHRSRKLREEGHRIKGRCYKDILPGGCSGHVNEAMCCATRNADNITRLGKEASSVDLVQIASLDDAKDFRLPVTMLRRPLSRRVNCLDEAELAAARGSR